MPICRSTEQSCRHRICCFYSGRVQGVGFRFRVKNLALRHDVAGYVRNLPDGRVELVMEGPDDQMDQLAAEVCGEMNGYIKAVDRNIQPATGEFDHFYIRH